MLESVRAPRAHINKLFMKKYPSVIIAALVAASVTSVFAQGTVVFNNNAEGLVQLYRFGDPGLIPMPKGGGQVQLFWAPQGTPYTYWTSSLTPAAWYSGNPGWNLGPVVGFTTPAPGEFNGGVLTLVPLEPPGGTIYYVIIAWTGNAQSFDEAVAGNSPHNVSNKFATTTGNPLAVPPGIPVPLADSFGGLTFYIPEPSGFALAALGAAILFALRRRK